MMVSLIAMIFAILNLSYLVWLLCNSNRFMRERDALRNAVKRKVRRKMKDRGDVFEIYGLASKPIDDNDRITNHIKRSLRPFTNSWKAYPVFVVQMMSKDPWKNYHVKKVNDRKIRFYIDRKLLKRVRCHRGLNRWDFDCLLMYQQMALRTRHPLHDNILNRVSAIG